VIEVERVEFFEDSIEMYRYQPDFYLSVYVSPYEATDRTVTWTSSDESIATVNDQGVVDAKSLGTVTITATANNGICASCTLTIKAGELQYEMTYDSSFYYVSGYTGYEPHVEIPNLYDGLRVIKIAPYAFLNHSHLESIIIPNSVEEIGVEAFKGCTSLESIVLNEGVEVIGSYAFAGCTSLKTVTLNEGLTTIYNNAFDGCTALEGISFPNSLTHIGNMAFRHADSLEYVNFSNNLSEIGNATFQYCVNLKEIQLPSNITSIGNSAFSFCSGLKTLKIFGDVQSFGNSAFYECRSIEEIYYNSSVDSYLGDSANNYIFYNAGVDGQGITLTVSARGIIPDGLFDPHAENLPKLTKIVVEDGATSVNYFTNRNYLPYLTEISLTDSVTEISPGIFNNSLWWENCDVGSVYINDVFYGYKCYCNEVTPSNAIEENLVESTCAKEGTYDSVIYCVICNVELSREQMTLPLSVFHDYDNNNKCLNCGLSYYESSSAVSLTLTDDGSAYKVTGCRKDAGHVVIPSSYNGIPVTTVASYAFKQKSGIYSIAFPDSIKVIEDSAAYECYDLEAVRFSNGLERIGSLAFWKCSLKEVVIPDSVTTVGNEVFAHCYDLKRVVIGNGIKHLGNSMFVACLGLTDVVLSENLESFGSAVFLSCDSLTNIELPDSLTDLGKRTFSSCSNLESIVIPNGVTLIATETFDNCDSLKSVTIPISVTTIESNAFSICEALETVNYAGDQAQWDNISIGVGNSAIEEATFNYNCVLK